MVNQAASTNPYDVSHSAGNGRLFVGREDIFAWIQGQLQETPVSLVLYGDALIGKTSLLKQIETGRLGKAFCPIFFDLYYLPLDSPSLFLWELAHTAARRLNEQGIALPKSNQPDFVADPYKSFNDQFLQPALAALNGRKLLFLFDNLHALLERRAAGVLESNTFHFLHHLTRENEQVCALYTLQLPASELAPEPLSFLNTLPYCEIGPLAPEATLALARQPVGYILVKDVAQYIHEVTGGHPNDVQLICHALYERRQQQNLNQVTVADVAMVRKHVLEKTAFAATAKQLPPYDIQNSTLTQTIQTANQPLRWLQRRPPLFAALLLILIAAVFLFSATFRQDLRRQWNAVMGLAPPATPTTAAPGETPAMEALALVTKAPTASLQSLAPTVTPSPTLTNTPAPTSTATVTPSPTATSTATPGDLLPVITRAPDDMPMILIPAGAFLMGSENGDVLAAPDEQPQHEVTLDNFYIDKYEVSVAQYAVFLNRLGTYDNACNHLDCALPQQVAGYTSYLLEQDLGDGAIQYLPVTGFATYPANHVSWFGASAYCQAMEARLPTEAEWEYAARGGDGRIYPWGNGAPNPTRAVYQSESFENLKPVDALPEGASPFGVYGLAGSVWEWIADWYGQDYYSLSPAVNPTGPESGLTRVIRGGAWPYNNEADRIRAANRSSITPDFLSSTIGFRCARTP